MPLPSSVARASRQHKSVVSLARWLGHSDPGFTLRKYSHFLPHAGARGSAAIDAMFA